MKSFILRTLNSPNYKLEFAIVFQNISLSIQVEKVLLIGNELGRKEGSNNS